MKLKYYALLLSASLCSLSQTEGQSRPKPPNTGDLIKAMAKNYRSRRYRKLNSKDRLIAALFEANIQMQLQAIPDGDGPQYELKKKFKKALPSVIIKTLRSMKQRRSFMERLGFLNVTPFLVFLTSLFPRDESSWWYKNRLWFRVPSLFICIAQIVITVRGVFKRFKALAPAFEKEVVKVQQELVREYQRKLSGHQTNHVPRYGG